MLTKYKQISDDITAAKMERSGEPGGSLDIYEKINPKTGKGCVVIFANDKGSYIYRTVHRTDRAGWYNEVVTVKPAKNGRAIMNAKFDEASAKIIFFGVE